MTKGIPALMVLLVGMVVLAGCAQDEPELGPGASGTDLGSIEGGPSDGGGGFDSGMADSGVVGEASAPARSQFADTGIRQDVVTGSLTMTADDPLSVADEAQIIVEEAGGRVDARTDSPAVDDTQASSFLTLRIPVDDLDSVQDDLEQLGSVTSVSIDRTDVTDQTQDLDARIAALRATVDRFRQLLVGAADTADLIAIETALSDRQGQLDSPVAQQTSLTDSIELATVSMQIQQKDTIAGGSGGIGGAFDDGWNALLSALAAVGLFLVAAIPWVVTIAIVAGLVVVVLRLRRRGRARRR